MHKLTISQLRKIISEEVKILSEGEKEDQAAAMAQNASKLLKAIEAFNSVASAKAKSTSSPSGEALDKHLVDVEKLLKRIVGSPLEYVDGPKNIDQQPEAGKKTVSLKPAR